LVKARGITFYEKQPAITAQVFSILYWFTDREMAISEGRRSLRFVQITTKIMINLNQT